MKETRDETIFIFRYRLSSRFSKNCTRIEFRRTTKQTSSTHLEDEQHLPLTLNNPFATSQLFIIRRVFLGCKLCFMQSFYKGENDSSIFLSFVSFIPKLRVDNVGYPVDRFRHAMIDSWLAWLRARVTRRNDAYQVPTPRLLQHQRSTAVTLREIRTREIYIYFFLLLSLDSTLTWHESLPPPR